MKKLFKYLLAAGFLEAWKLTGFRVKKVATRNDFGAPKKIAVFSTTALGDFLLNTPAIKAIKACWPEAKVVLVINQRNRQLVGNSDLFTEVLFWNGKVNGMMPLARALKKHHIDATFILHSRSPYDIITAHLARSAIILKDVYYNDYQGRETFFLARYLSCHFDNRREGAIHLIEQKMKLLRSAGIPTMKPYEMTIPASYTPWPRERVTVGIHAGASNETRCWPTENFALLIEQLLRAFPQIEIELLGGPGEVERNQNIISRANIAADRIANLAGKTDLTQLMERISSQACLIVGDTGPLHVAVAAKIATIALFPQAETAPGARPIQDPELHSVLISPDSSQGISAIAVETVFNAVQQKLAKLCVAPLSP